MAFKKKPMTAAERDAHKEKKAGELEAAMDMLKKGVAALLTSDGYRAYLQNLSQFHNYSYRNMILILMQLPTATRCAGFYAWKKMGRTVKKGEKGLKILAPSPFTITKTDKESGEEKKVKIMRFTTVSTFDVSQTEGKPLPSSGANELMGTSDTAEWLWEKLTALAVSHGATVARGDTLPAHGYFRPSDKSIVVGSHLEGNHAAKTLCHEVAHMIADHDYHRDGRDNAETVAESAAFVVLNRYGIDTSDYTFGYVANWARDEKVLHQNLTDVQKIAHEIIEALEGADADAETDDSADVEAVAA
jgi:antirestriction protein ArdC